MQHAEHAERTVIAMHGQPDRHPEPDADADVSIWTSVDDTAARLGVSRWTVIRAFQAGSIPGIKFGATYNLLRVFVDDLVALVHAGNGVDFEHFAESWRALRTDAKEMAS
jgi:hypothetical protein